MHSEIPTNLMINITEGMKVYDKDTRLIGIVESVHLGAESDEAISQRHAPVPDPNVSIDPQPAIPLAVPLTGLSSEENIPNELQERLLRSGYLRANSGGLWRISYYVLPDQISWIWGDSVTLNVAKDELIRA